jgi:predicted ATPase
MNQLVGRQQELEAISAKLTAVHAGRGGTLFLSGEPGIGKSALARQLAEQADDLSLSVYWGFCWEAGGAPAYWPWTQSLRSLVSDRTVEPEQLAKLGQLLPESAGEDTQPELQPDQARFQLLEATRTLLDEITRKQPVVLVVEDLHAADTDSLHLLQYLARHAGTMPLLLVGTYRELEARQSPTTDPLWQATRDAQVLQLSRLDEDSVREFLESGSGGHADSERVRDLFNTTEGNPLFLNELVGLLEQTGDEKLPETVQQVIRQQIELLPEATARNFSLLRFQHCATRTTRQPSANLKQRWRRDSSIPYSPGATASLTFCIVMSFTRGWERPGDRNCTYASPDIFAN